MLPPGGESGGPSASVGRCGGAGFPSSAVDTEKKAINKFGIRVKERPKSVQGPPRDTLGIRWGANGE